MKRKLYEVECHRTNISPRQFWTYCIKRFKEKAGFEFNWIDSFNDWEDPMMESDIKSKHEDWDTPALELCCIKPMEYHLYLESGYNFIMEWFDGVGYFYVTEWER